MADISPKIATITARSGRYQIFLANGRSEAVIATADDIDALYRKLIDPRQVATRTYIGYGWISPEDHGRYPITSVVANFL